LQAYLDEMCWRFDNRKNPYLFRDTVNRMLNADSLEFKNLISEKAAWPSTLSSPLKQALDVHQPAFP
jgi:hypothetical protein